MEDMILFRNLKHKDIFTNMCCLAENGEGSSSEMASGVVSDLISLAVRYGFEGNLWHCFLSYTLINNENPFTLQAEKRGKTGGTLEKAALHDVSIFMLLFKIDLYDVGKNWGPSIPLLLSDFRLQQGDNEGETFNKRIRDRIVNLADKLAKAETDREFLEELCSYYKDFGVGKYGQHKAFRVRHNEADEVVIEPITRVKHVHLDDLVGLESQKKKLRDNTEAFLQGRKANNVLLFGDAGTGKSTCVKGLLNEYFPDGLRVIEIFKHQFRDLNDIVKEIKNRNYKFIIYMDDLSFEDAEVEYKYLKAVIEGGLEKKPDNILIYATSNRRHLIHEGFSDKLDRKMTDDIHESDTVQEKLSLSARFGEKIYFGRPGKKEFDHIVLELAHRRGIAMSDEELLYEANKWELSHGGKSGRTAEQFMDYIEGVRRPGGV